jgi:hypothetical protein
MHEEPIVCNPSDALRAFEDGGLDYLAMGNYLLRHPDKDYLSTSCERQDQEKPTKGRLGFR